MQRLKGTGCFETCNTNIVELDGLLAKGVSMPQCGLTRKRRFFHTAVSTNDPSSLSECLSFHLNQLSVAAIQVIGHFCQVGDHMKIMLLGKPNLSFPLVVGCLVVATAAATPAVAVAVRTSLLAVVIAILVGTAGGHG